MTGGLFGEEHANGAIDVRAFFDSDVAERLWELVSLGCLISVGSARDGGAISLSVTFDGEYEREWFRETDSAGQFLAHAAAIVRKRGATERGGAAIAPQKAVRRRSGAARG